MSLPFLQVTPVLLALTLTLTHNARSYADSNPNIHYYADAIFAS